MNSVTEVAGTYTAGYGAAYSTDTDTDSDVNFSDVLAKALEEETANVSSSLAGLSGLGSMSAYSAVQSGGLEQMILAASASGEIDDAQIALFMLCAMMQSSQDSDFSPLMALMAEMLTKIQGDTGALRDNVMMSEYDPYVLDQIDKNVFMTKTPDVTGTGQAVLPAESWKPATPAVTSSQDDRSPERLRAVIDQFNVETATRYKPYRNGNDTYCNIFLWDVTRALGCEIPHYVDAETGQPREYPDIKGAKEMGAIATDKWMIEHGSKYGWKQVDAETAQKYANEGKPAITTAGEIGHVQVVCPSKDGGYDPIRGVTVAQAGSKVTGYTYLSSIYSSAGQKNVKYFVHE